jgi:hypothetical protein
MRNYFRCLRLALLGKIELPGMGGFTSAPKMIEVDYGQVFGEVSCVSALASDAQPDHDTYDRPLVRCFGFGKP